MTTKLKSEARKDIAEEFRARASEMRDPETRRIFYDLADQWDELARKSERLEAERLQKLLQDRNKTPP